MSGRKAAGRNREVEFAVVRIEAGRSGHDGGFRIDVGFGVVRIGAGRSLTFSWLRGTSDRENRVCASAAVGDQMSLAPDHHQDLSPLDSGLWLCLEILAFFDAFLLELVILDFSLRRLLLLLGFLLFGYPNQEPRIVPGSPSSHPFAIYADSGPHGRHLGDSQLEAKRSAMHKGHDGGFRMGVELGVVWTSGGDDVSPYGCQIYMANYDRPYQCWGPASPLSRSAALVMFGWLVGLVPTSQRL
ncbi:hypothetical protein C8R43DRAFT_964453 [Mycena crocata]|nr:hypothetical protein C8R43DRAFT_964453 [Mycena crocata]